MLKLRPLLIHASLLLFALFAHAQNVTTPQRQTNDSGSGVIVSFVGGSALSGKPGLPFSADVIDETDRVLADGNHIHRETHGKIFRDSQGRTRLETEVDIGGSAPMTHVTISDPVEGLHMMLNLTNKTATVAHFPQHLLSSGGSEKISTPVRQAPTPQNSATVEKFHSSKGETKEIEGFTVKVTRNTRTIPAGAKGNDKPLVITNETWVSEDLATVLLTIREDPESGKSVRKLVNIHTGDPDPLLFKVPADFTVKDISQQ